jgi:hypothetical protein
MSQGKSIFSGLLSHPLGSHRVLVVEEVSEGSPSATLEARDYRRHGTAPRTLLRHDAGVLDESAKYLRTRQSQTREAGVDRDRCTTTPCGMRVVIAVMRLGQRLPIEPTPFSVTSSAGDQTRGCRPETRLRGLLDPLYRPRS